MNTPSPLPDTRFFDHEAMNTTFRLRLRGLDEGSSRGVARLCFERIDAIESQLSRFIEGSEVSRINRLAAGETLFLSDECHRCLLLALDAYARTEGLFDITIGSRIKHRKANQDGPAPPLSGRLTIHPDTPAVTCDEPGREIDLGGIGKGFALDELKPLLADWGVEDALLAAGASSLLAIGPQAWPVDLTGDSDALRVELRDQSISASGTGIQGSHIIHPWGAEAMPAKPNTRVWVVASTAALAEVWSTALMLVETDEIAGFIAGNDEIAAVFADDGLRVRAVR
jgi:thiamine biosynthesis lipoprotein